MANILEPEGGEKVDQRADPKYPQMKDWRNRIILNPVLDDPGTLSNLSPEEKIGIYLHCKGTDNEGHAMLRCLRWKKSRKETELMVGKL